jgi:hypothetical protein
VDAGCGRGILSPKARSDDRIDPAAFVVPFIVNCDASGSGSDAVLHQDAGPIAFYSRPVAPQYAKLAAYERELIGLVQAMRHWRP